MIADGLPDEQVLELAAEQGRVLVSHDLATMAQHFQAFTRHSDSPGLILVPQRLSIGAAIEELCLAWTCQDTEEFRNVILYLPL